MPQASQGRLSLAFFEAVTNRTVFDATVEDVQVTGHSLGGGLAGFVGALSGNAAYGFDHMPFGAAAYAQWLAEFSSRAVADGLSAATIPTADLIARYGMHVPTFGRFDAAAVAAEVNAGLRNGLYAGAIGALLGAIPFIGPALAALGGSIAGGQIGAEAAIDVETLDTYGWLNFNPIDRHSIALLVLLKYAKDKESADPEFGKWHTGGIANSVLRALYDSSIAIAAGAEDLPFDGRSKDGGDFAAIARGAIAYSAIDEGERPFGDTGIRSLFNDAGDLGTGVDVQTTGVLDKHVRWQFALNFNVTLKEALSDILVQYAEALALYDVEEAKVVGLGEVKAQDGVLALNDDESILALDFSSVLWGDVLRKGDRPLPAGIDRVEPVGIYDISSTFFEQSEEVDGDLLNSIQLATNLGGNIDEDFLKRLAAEFWLSTDARIFDRYHFLLKDSPDGHIKLAERIYPTGPRTGNDTHVDVAVGTSGANKLTGTKGNDLLLLGNGDDTVYTLSGRDMVIAGAGDDTMVNNVVSESASGDGEEGGDVFIGQRLNSSIYETFLQWLLAPDGLESAADQFDYWADDIVRYSVADPATGSLAAQGATITDLRIDKFGEHDAIKVTIKDLNSGAISTDTLLNVDVIELTERAEEVVLSGDMSKVPVVIDFGGPKDGKVYQSDYDTISFAGRSGGMQTVNGSTKDYQGGFADSLITLTAVVATDLLRSAFDPILGPTPEVHFRDAENVKLTNEDDVYFGGNLQGLLGIDHGFFGESNHPGFGKIEGGAGRDILVYYGATHKDVGERISSAEGENAIAGEELDLIVDGGSGNDWLIAIGGEKAITAGGLGRDWIFNTSDKGELYGDYYGGLSPEGQPAPDTGENSDNFWYWADTTIMDAQHFDVLKYFGIPLTGGDANGGAAGLAIMGMLGSAIGMANISRYMTGQAQDWTGEVYVDHLQPWMLYLFKRDEDGNLDMYITNAFEQIFRGMMAAIGGQAGTTPDSIHKGFMKVENVDVIGSRLGILQRDLTNDVLAGRGQGDLSMVFRAVNPLQALLPVINLVPGLIGQALYWSVFADALISTAAAAERFAKAMDWADGTDPLVIDLDGDGIETVSRDYSKAYFDVDGDMFRERTGWLKGDDGFLVLDSNGNGTVDGIAELFGDRAQGGFAELSAYDSNGDGMISAADLIWSELQIWQDRDRDGETDAGELKSLDALGIVSLSLSSTPLNVMTPQNATLLSRSDVTFADGRVSKMFEAIFGANEVDTKFAGEAGFAPWQSNDMLNAKGFGTVTDLAVAAANDPEFAELAQARAEAMTVPKMKTLVAQAGDVLGQWGMTLETSRELVAVRLDAAGAMLDRAVYVEDEAGGYWTLDSGASVVDGAGAAIARPTLEQVLAQGGGWRLEQAWSPASRGEPLTKRDEAPYLMRVENGRAIILDYGIKQADGRWALASAPGTTYAGVDAILALPHAAGTEWRREDIQFNPLADLPVEAIGVRFTDGKVVDYTVQVTDRDGTFYVWARNLDRALELEAKTGDYREFNLRNYEVDFENLDEVGSTDDSTYRVELLTPAQFHFAMSLGGIAFRPEMLTAVANDATGHLAYSVNESGSASLSPDSYVSAIKSMISMLQPVMEQWVMVSRRFAVRMALQGGLSEFARGISYDAERNVFLATTDRQLAPMFEAIFEGAPDSNANDAVLDYLTDWNELLWQIYPDFAQENENDVLKGKVGIDQAYIMQMLIQAYENVGVDLDIFGVAHALSVDETRIRTHLSSDTQVAGTDGTDFFYMTGGNQTVTGGMSADYYFVGKNSGDDYIYDKDLGGEDELRFTDVKSNDVKAIRDGQDLILQIRGRTNFIRLTDQFLGELNEYATNGKQFQSGVEQIVFSDGIVWDRFRMALEVVDYERAEGLFNDPLTGSGSADVLMGGKGNDFLSGNVGGDIYVFRRGDGQDVINDLGGFSFGPVKAGIDFLQFRGDISAKDLYLIRDGASDNLKLYIRDENGNINRDANGQITNDGIEIVGQFGGVRLNMGAFGEALGSSDGLDYIAPNLIERFIFGDGTSLEFTEIVKKVLENAKTTGDDAIYGLLNDNTLDGGKGDDYLTGREGTDTYVYGSDYGQDVIEDADFSLALFGPKDDFLKFSDDLRWTDFDFLREGKSDTLTLQVKGTTDQLILREYLKEVFLVGYVNLIETITFADGTNWSYLKLLQHYVDIAKTDGNDTIYGFEGISDSIDGGLGNDRLEGLSGNDRYVFGRGYGTDTILDESGEERIQFQGIASTEITFSRTALDLIMTVTATGERIVLENQYVRDDKQHFAVEYFEFTDRTLVFTDFNPEDMDLVGTNAGEEITGSNFAETLDGRGGNDTLIGGDGGDTYKFDVGYGQDVIVDRRIRAHWSDRPGFRVPVDDVVVFGDDITLANIVFTKSGDDLLISVRDRTDTLRIRNHFRSIDDQIERFEFRNGGNFLTVSDIEEILQIEGGNYGDNVITGSLTQPNTLDGRQGDDTLIGGNAGDSYAFTAGYDFDRIVERPDQAGVIDRIVFGASVTQDVLRFLRSGNDLLIDLGNGTDVVTVVGGLTNTRVEEFHFADGAVLTLEQVLDRMLTGTEADEQLTGFDNRADTIAGGAGSDALAGGNGNDTYKFGFGDGNDSISDTAGIDKIVFGPSVTQEHVTFRNVDGDLLITLGTETDRIVVLGGYSAAPIESFVFADGTTLTLSEVRRHIWTTGTNTGDDIVDLRDFDAFAEISPGRGNDRVIMRTDGRAIINAGDGVDRIEMPSGVTRGTIVLADMSPANVVVRLSSTDSNDLIITVPGAGNEITIVGALGGAATPTIEFGDGSMWDAAALIQRSVADQSSSGDDFIRGSSNADTITGGAGDDRITGNAGNDTYIFSIGDGRDVIDDSSGADTLRISGYQADEMRVSRSAPGRNELVLTLGDGADEILLRYDAALNGVDKVEFGDGTSFTRDQLFARINGEGSDGDDRLVGTTAAEPFTGGRGNDVLIGGGGNDVYRFNRGDGQDRIEANGTADGLGTLEFGAGIALEDIAARRDSAGNIVIRIAGSDDSVTLVDLPGDVDPVVATLLFADGRTLSFAALASSIAFTDGDDHIALSAGQAGAVELYGGLGNDWIEAGRGADLLTGGKGNDRLEGQSGADIYYFDRGDGQDVIVDFDETSSTRSDRIRFGTGILPTDIRFLSVGPTDLVIGLVGGEDRLTIRNMFVAGTSSTDHGIEEFAFADGTVWTLSQIYARAAIGTAGDDAIDFGTAIEVSAPIVGGKGDDTLAGGFGDNGYSFGRGDGRDVIRETNDSRSSDTLTLGNDIAVADVVVVRVGNDLVLRLKGGDDRLTLVNQAVGSWNPIEEVVFVDGTRWTAATLLANAVTPEAAERLLNPASAADPFTAPIFSSGGGGTGGETGGGDGGIPSSGGPQTLTGTAERDTFRMFVPLLPDEGVITVVAFQTGDSGDILDIRLAEGLTGSVVARQEGADAFVYFAPTGTSSLDSARLLFRLQGVAASALTLGNFNGAPFELAANLTLTGDNAANTLKGSWGNDSLTGNGGNDTLTGGPGNDTLRGNDGSDVYKFSRGFGQDIVTDAGWRTQDSPNDVIEFDSTISPDDVTVEQTTDGVGLILKVTGTDDRITIPSTLNDASYRIEAVRFVAADGIVTSWNHAQLVAKATVPTAADQTLHGSYDWDTYDGGAGNDTIYGISGNDSLTGGTGHDYLQGGEGSDTYKFSRGFGQDIVSDAGWRTQDSPSDVIEFDSTIAPDDVTIEQTADGVGLVIKVSGTDDRITIPSTLNDASYRIETVRFVAADGTVTSWSHAQLVAKATVATAADQTLHGSYDSDTFDGGTGNDTLYGNDGNDTLTGGVGNDYLQGHQGSDLYKFSRGFGQDIVSDAGWRTQDSPNDVIEFDSTILPDEVTVEQTADGVGLILKVTGTDDRITIPSTLNDASYRIEAVRFVAADGTVTSWSHTQLLAKAMVATSADQTIPGTYDWDTYDGGAGNDTLYGADGNDTLTGGTGNDYLQGQQGSDLYKFSRGFGQDIVSDAGWRTQDSPNDVIEFDSTITPEELTVELTADGVGLILKVTGTEDRITIPSTLNDASYRIEAVRFVAADGTVTSWSHTQLLAKAMVVATSSDQTIPGTYEWDTYDGGAGNDTLYGADGNDTLTGGAGNDYLQGQQGSDTYKFSRGFGQDIVSDAGWRTQDSPNDVIEFDSTVTADDVTVEQTSDGAGLILRVIGTEDRITIPGTINDASYRIEAVRFVAADGTVTSWAHADLMARLTPAVGAGVTLIGTGAADTLTGSARSDTVLGAAGDDVIVGDSNVVIQPVGENLIVNGSFEQHGTAPIAQSWGFDASAIPGWTKLNSQVYQLHTSGFGSVGSTDGGYWLDLDSAGGTGTNMIISQVVSGLTAGEQLQLRFDHANRSTASGDTFEVLWNGEVIATVAATGTTMLRKNYIVVARAGDNELTFRGLGSTNGAGPSLDNVQLQRVEQVEGTTVGKDTLDGGAGNDTLYGGGSDDSLIGGTENDTLYGESGDDSLAGGAGNDIMVGGTGTDALTGAAGDDVYRFNAGDGQDTITDTAGIDRIELGEGIDRSNVRVRQQGSANLVIEILGSNDRLTLVGALNTAGNAIEEVRFFEGDPWTHAELLAMAMAGTEANDVRYGTAAADSIHGGLGDDTISGLGGSNQLFGDSGNDTLTGGADDDTLTGGTGGDSLAGGAGNDVYRFNPGDGFDTITDTAGIDRIELGAGIDPLDVQVRQSGTGLVLRIGEQDRITIAGAFGNAANAIEEVRFFDSTVWTHAQLISMSLGTGDGNDVTNGTSAADTISGGLGRDSLSGGAGDDTLTGGDDDDTLAGGTENDALYGEAGHDSLAGDAGNDLLVGGTGNDSLVGAAGDDVYRFDLGDGQDTITDTAGVDRIEFGADINSDMVRVRQQGSTGLALTIAGTSDRLTLVNALSTAGNAIEEVRFVAADGTVTATWTFAELLARSMESTDGNDILYGTSAADSISGGAGDDIINALGGHDALSGEAGNDSLTGDVGDDILIGGIGNDSLAGAAGNDVYRFNIGDGQDTITDTAGIDRVELGAGITIDDVRVVQQGTTGLILKIGTGDRLILANVLSAAANAIESVYFTEDGTSWNAAELARRATGGTPGEDVYNGSANADELSGLGGNDTLLGNAGNDILSGGADKDRLEGGAGADQLAGGTGADMLTGGAGADTYVFNAGDGLDEIDDNGDATADALQINGYSLGQIRFSRTGGDGNDLTIRFAGSADRIILRSALAGTAADTVEQFVIAASGVTLSLADVMTRLTTDVASTGEILYGTAEDDVLTGGVGDDFISGGTGADTMVGG
ncbi:MAG: calcium-binding protein, partial [Allosphingosinicella sp.]